MIKLAKIPNLRSPHDDSALNILNLAIDKINRIWKIDEISEDVKQMLQEVIDVHAGRKSKYEFEIGTISNATGDYYPSTTAMRTKIAIPLKAGDVVQTTSNSTYEYSLMLYKNGEWVGGWGLGWYKFGTNYQVPEDCSAFVVVARVDRANLTESEIITVENAFSVERNSVSTNANVITPTFEKGGWWGSTGEKVTGDNPTQIRTTMPYSVMSGMSFTPKSSSVYEYNVLLFKDGNSLGWGSWTDFGITYTFDDDVEARISVERKDGAAITDTDLKNVKDLFGDIKLDLVTFLESLGVLSVENTISFEPGGWLESNGNKVTGEAPYQIRNTEPFKSYKGMVLNPVGSGYNYNVLLFKNGQSLGWQNRVPFGTSFEFDDVYDVRLSAERLDQAPVTGEDENNVTKAFRNNIQSVQSVKPIDKFNIIGKLDSVLTEPITNHFSSPNSTKAQTVHNSIISLVQANSDCASYKLLGQDGYSNNMYSYESKPNIMKDGGTEWLRPPRGTDGTNMKPPKIIITAGVHGKERSASYAVYQFMYNLLENPTNNPVFDTLRQNVHFIFIPIGTPNGFDDNSYENRAGVNINREFPPYGSVTQPEAKHIKKVLDDNKDADYHIDFHNFYPWDYNNDLLGYSLTDDKDFAILTTNAYKYVGRQWQLKHSNLPQDRNYQWTYTANANVGTVGKYTTDVLGIPGTIIETPHWLNLMGEKESDIHSALVTQLGVDILSNLVVGILEARK